MSTASTPNGLPNLPDPVNGMVKTYENEQRTFSRPYSAKNVIFYKDGDERFQGVRVPVSKNRYRTMDSLLDDLSDRLDISFGVRRVFTSNGRHEIQDPKDLDNMGRYVCTSTKFAKRLNLSAIERLQKQRADALERDRSFRRFKSTDSRRDSMQQSPSVNRMISGPNLGSSRSSGIVTKQVVFVLNSDPHRLYRARFRPPSLPSFDNLLTEVSQALQLPITKLYKQDGRKVLTVEDLLTNGQSRVLACTQFEKPANSLQSSAGGTKLPSVHRTPNHMVRGAEFRAPATKAQRSSSATLQPRTTSSSIDSLPPVMGKRGPGAGKHKRELSNSSLPPANNRKPLQKTNRRMISPALKKNKLRKRASPIPKGLDLTKKPEPEPEPEQDSAKQEKAVTTLQAAARGYRVRKEIREQNEAAKKIQKFVRKKNEHRSEENNEESVEVGMEACDFEQSALRMQALVRAWFKWKRRTFEKETSRFLAEIAPEIRERAATVIQCYWRRHQAQKQYKQLDAFRKHLSKMDGDKARKASVCIQRTYRGFSVRKQYSRPTEVEHSPWSPLMSPRLTPPSRKHKGSQAGRKSHAEIMEEKETAAVKLQAGFRGMKARRELQKRKQSRADTPATAKNVRSEVQSSASSRSNTNLESPPRDSAIEQPKEADATQTGLSLYTIMVFTGNRFSADTEADLYVTMYGSQGKSGKLWLKQEPNDRKFAQNQVDTFEVQCDYLGKLRKIVVGHTQTGYGAGVFLDRLIVVDTVHDYRQYVFFCSKWMDSGQVDGKIERVLTSAGYYNLNSGQRADEAGEVGENTVTKGRWQLDIQTASKTSSNVVVTGHGTFATSDPIHVADAKSSIGLVQTKVDFGDIGELLKIRLEIDGVGANKELMIEGVGLTDLDTADEMYLECGRLLSMPNTQEPKGTPFRELPAIRAQMDPFPLIKYAGRIKCSNLPTDERQVYTQIIGELGASGILPVLVSKNLSEPGSEDVSFTLESVSLGRLHHVIVWIPVNEQREKAAEGLAVLQDIYDKHTTGVNAETDWSIDRIVVRESLHAPYRFMFGSGKVETNDWPGHIRKRMRLTGMEGLTTKAKHIKHQDDTRKQVTWLSTLVSGDHNEAGTNTELMMHIYGDKGATGPTVLNKEPILFGQTTTFEMTTKNIGLPFKVRLALRENSNDSESCYVKRLKLRDQDEGYEMRFPIEMWIDPDTVLELPIAWPDLPPLPLVLYQVTIVSATESPQHEPGAVFDVSLNISGTKGDTGTRVLRSGQVSEDSVSDCFQPGSMDAFDVESVTCQQLDAVTLTVQAVGSTSIVWAIDRIQIFDADTQKLYIFDAKCSIKTSAKNKCVTKTIKVTDVTDV